MRRVVVAVIIIIMRMVMVMSGGSFTEPTAGAIVICK